MSTALSEKILVRELAANHPTVIPVLERYGIDYCCGGGRDLHTAAADSGVDLGRLIEALEESLETDSGSGNARDWSKASLTELADYIEERHHTFMREQLPRLTDLFRKVVKAHRERHGELLANLQNIYDSLRMEIEQHLMKEEQILFPYIRQIEAYVNGKGEEPIMHCGSVQNPIRQMEHEHDNAGNALQGMRELSSGYSLPEDACASFHALYDGLTGIERDLHEHIHLENNILFPRIIELERAGGIAQPDALPAETLNGTPSRKRPIQ